MGETPAQVGATPGRRSPASITFKTYTTHTPLLTDLRPPSDEAFQAQYLSLCERDLALAQNNVGAALVCLDGIAKKNDSVRSARNVLGFKVVLQEYVAAKETGNLEKQLSNARTTESDLLRNQGELK